MISGLVPSTPRLNNDPLQLLDLGLGPPECPELPLGVLAGALVLAVAQQFDDAALVGRKTGNLPDDSAHELGALAQLALPARGLGLGDARGGFLFEMMPLGRGGLRLAEDWGSGSSNLKLRPLFCPALSTQPIEKGKKKSSRKQDCGNPG
jgi:hypothetical protein